MDSSPVSYTTRLRNISHDTLDRAFEVDVLEHSIIEACLDFEDVFTDTKTSIHSFIDSKAAAKRVEQRKADKKDLGQALITGCLSNNNEDVYIELANERGTKNAFVLRDHQGGIAIFLNTGKTSRSDKPIYANPKITLADFRAKCRRDVGWDRELDIKTMDAEDLKRFQSICGLTEDKLKEIAGLIASGDTSILLRLFEGKTFQIVANFNGIHCINKVDGRKLTLVSQTSPNTVIAERKNSGFCELVMRLQGWSEAQYRDFAKEMIEAGANKLYEDLSETDDSFIQSQLNMMVDGMDQHQRDQLIPLLDKSFWEVAEVNPDTTSIKVIFKNGEVIHFSNRKGENHEYRGEKLLTEFFNHLKSQEKQHTTLKEWILNTKGTRYDSAAMGVLRAIRSQTVENILGLLTNDAFDPNTREFLLQLNIRGINPDTVKTYVAEVFKTHLETAARHQGSI